MLRGSAVGTACGTAFGRRAFLAAAMASVAAPAVIRAAWGAAPQFTLKLHHAFSSVSCVHDNFLAPWARTLEAQSGGHIRIEIFPSMQLGGQPAQLFDQARQGIADIVWTMPSKTPGRFPKIELFELPFVPSRRALVSSNAIEDFSSDYLKDEFRDIHPICFSCADRGIVHSRRPIVTVADLRGLRLDVPTRFAGGAVQTLGARAVAVPSAQLPMAITRRVVDGSIIPWDMVPALKLDQLLKAHTDFADYSLSTTTFVLAMNKMSYDRLPADLKKIIDDNSGQHAAGMAGAMWDLQASAVADMVSQHGAAIVTLAPEAVAHWRQATEPVIQVWLKQMKERNVDGGKLLASAQASLDKYASLPEPQPPQPPQAAQPSQPPAAPQAKPDANPQPKAGSPLPAPSKPAATAVPAPSPAAKPPPAAAPGMTLDIPL
jgi:TRAP-type transport system periplasmic protein